jgi:hypothetical protein
MLKFCMNNNSLKVHCIKSNLLLHLKFHPPFFLFFAWRPSWLEVGITGHIFERGPSKDHSTKVWLQLVQWFLRRGLKCEMLTDDDFGPLPIIVIVFVPIKYL